MNRVSRDALTLVERQGLCRFDVSEVERAAVEDLAAFVAAALGAVDHAALPTLAGSIHDRVASLLLAVDTVAQGGGTAATDSAFRRKCHEYRTYLAAKLAERGIAFASVASPLPAAGLDPDWRREFATGVLEVLVHLGNHAREWLIPAGLLGRSDLRAASGAFTPVVAKPRRSRRPVFFQHVQKTGGTSIIDTLRLFFTEDRMSYQGEHLVGDRDIADALSGLRDFDFVASHSDILSAAPDKAFTFTILRDPYERLLSGRRQYMQAREENLAAESSAMADAILALRQRPLRDILDRLFDHPRLVFNFWNHQALTLGVWPLVRSVSRVRACSAYGHACLDRHFETAAALRVWLDDNSGAILREAKTALRRLDFIGLMNDFDASTHEIFARIGLPEPGEVVVRNAREAFDDESDPGLREAAKDYLALDEDLYDTARELHDRQGRVMRGMPVDYTGRFLSATAVLAVSCREPPGGHGWYPAHERGDGTSARWTGPGLESRFSLAAEPGRYRLTIDIYGAASNRSLDETAIVIGGERQPVERGSLPDGCHTISTTFDRDSADRFDIVVTCPDVGTAYGLEVKQLVFQPLPEPDAASAPGVATFRHRHEDQGTRDAP